MSAPAPNDATLVAAAVREIGDPAVFEAPDGYGGSLALGIVDSIWSMGVRYQSVVNVVNRYREFVRAHGGDPEQRSASQLIADIEAAGGPSDSATTLSATGSSPRRPGACTSRWRSTRRHATWWPSGSIPPMRQ